MKRALTWACLIVAGVFLYAGQEKVETRTIDGVPHVLNPAKPLKGTINLEVERTRTINPYDQPDVGLKMIVFARDSSGQVILYDPNGAEAHRFASDGKYLGLLTKKGQGPGEFSPMQGYYVNFYEPDIWVFGGRKAARFDGQGRLIKDKVLTSPYYEGVDAQRFFTVDVKWNEKKDQIRTLKLIGFSMDGGEEKAVDILQAENIGLGHSEFLLCGRSGEEAHPLRPEHGIQGPGQGLFGQDRFGHRESLRADQDQTGGRGKIDALGAPE